MTAHPAPTRHPLGAFATVMLVVLAVCVIGLLLFYGALLLISDEGAEPEVQPLEVVVNSSRRPEPCLLNVDQVRAGDHPVSVIGESGYAKVRIVDEHGKVVLRTDNEGQRITTDDDGDVTIHGGEGEGEGPAAHLDPGTFTIVCRPQNGEPGEATLKVLPARPDR